MSNVRNQVLSARKQQLAIAERIAIVAAVACIVIALLCSTDEHLSQFSLTVVLIALGAMFYLALLIAGLTTELNSALGKVSSTNDEGPYSSISEIRWQLRWSPKSYRVAALVAFTGVIITAVVFGAVSWSTSEPFTSRNALGSSLYLLCVLLN
ncbi:MAG: hypothetical protein ACKVOA_06625 [Methylophilaceae bacterium]